MTERMDLETFQEITSAPAVLAGKIWDQDAEEFIDIPTIVGLPHELTAAVKVMLSGEEHESRPGGVGSEVVIEGEFGSRLLLTRAISARTMLTDIGVNVPTLEQITAKGIAQGFVGGPQVRGFDHIRGQRVADVESYPAGCEPPTGMYL
jgi:hypothetical protein